MNSEELEQSLKTEFGSYLKSVLAEMKQETADFQSRIETEFEKHRTQIDEAFKGFMASFDSERSFDAAFQSSVAEHLRLARDEGARVAANAMVEAENLGQSPLAAVPVAAPAETKYNAIRDAVDDISSKESQSAILKALVHHAANFAPRGAFFIIKSEHFAGWKVFGATESAENAIRDVHFPVSSDTFLASAVTSRTTATEPRSADGAFVDPLDLADGSGGIAIPLVARGRGVAVLFADNGADGNGQINREALETIVRVAGLTVELLASMQTAKADNRVVAAADFENVATQPEEVEAPQVEVSSAFEHASAPVAAVDNFETAPSVSPFEQQVEAPSGFPAEEPAPLVQLEEQSFSFSDSVSYEGGLSTEVSANPFDAEPAAYGQFETTERIPSPLAAEPAIQEAMHEENPFAEQPYPGDEVMRERIAEQPAPQEELVPESPFQSFESPVVEQPVPPSPAEMVFEDRPAFQEPPVTSPFEQPREQFEPATVASGSGFAHQAETEVLEAPVVKAPVPRLSERNVDLPIEVPEEERRIHNDARRFARLLVSEIKLYNEKKVVEGREAGDLYDRLREAIDRSREMYDKRVQPPVAAKFDYFHYEIVNSLAEGSPEKLGAGYPGASV